MPLETEFIQPPTSSHIIDIVFIEESFCAKNELEASFINSEDQELIFKIRFLFTQTEYSLLTKFLQKISFLEYSKTPRSTREGLIKSFIAVPSAKNSGLDIIV